MSIAVLAITDGRDEYLQQCIPSAMANLAGPVTERWMFDDTGSDTYRRALAARYPTFRHINGGPRRGFGGAIRSAWRHLAEHSAARYVFHLEGDFTFERPVDLAAMAAVLDSRPHLAQMALVRQAWNEEEAAAGGVIHRFPGAYQPCSDPSIPASWLEHRLFFTTNPSLYPARLRGVGWPDGAQSEGRFAAQLLTDGLPAVAAADVRFGYWGSPDDQPWVIHIGQTRAGNGY